jgi:hypothetical protein
MDMSGDAAARTGEPAAEASTWWSSGDGVEVTGTAEDGMIDQPSDERRRRRLRVELSDNFLDQAGRKKIKE